MACGCNGGAQDKYKVNAADGTSKTFATEVEANVYAAKRGGIIVKL